MRKAINMAFLLALILAPVMVSYAEVDIKNAVGIWLLDDSEGDVAKDSTGNGFDGKIAGAKWGNGRFDKALAFDGNSVINITSHDRLNIGEQLTMMAFFNATTLNNFHVIVAKNLQYFLRIDIPGEGGKMSAFVNLDGNWEPRASAGVPVKDKWYHFAATYSSETQSLIVYIDGSKAGQSVRAGKPIPNNELLTIGILFMGMIDDVAIFDVALEEADIKNIATNGLKSALNLDAVPQSVSSSNKLGVSWGNLKG